MRRALLAAIALATPACFSAATECQNTLDCTQGEPAEAGADGDAADAGDAIADGGEASTIDEAGMECDAVRWMTFHPSPAPDTISISSHTINASSGSTSGGTT